ncbi:Transcriptional regulatory protein ZraR [Gemmata obscuriglobus]|uniref:DNA-binding transcriptional regulator NtrC n=1 Tax=Gemmata obscuriglobus TaxID=114 RepID=A0A2Z3H4X0_9BACT|nr:sigma-54 dependent transcriptional regulator [Gemmata obscuriglobus]AWM39372.1 Fis family transcriptional regulator [Gemmata obscuriglobus]QEG27557.1 Transcriptional regulatory protein ZraR [Gemmata obscuriglobus]VTS04633.1 response regulator with -like aaa-type and dna-binding domains : Response regulator with CheY-like receiver, AAA-type ATPase, and DNA-binding domains OS=Singulisphaera acidiphila (strain ATCC BAA-1392 / DSM 18658 / VKM B-2454 / MOB10) GN=Sinac_0782 PE=4 SV=1: Response_reg:
MANLLIVDDEESLLYSLEAGLSTDDLAVSTATTGREGVAAVRAQTPDAVILDVRLPDMTGLEVFDQIRALDPRLPVVMITAYAAADTAIEAVKRGAFEYLLKPVDLHRLRDTVARAIELRRMRSVPAVIAGEPAPPDADEVVGRSPAMQAVYKAIGLLARQAVPVLITGESGTGKELIARTLYQHSERADRPLLALDCSATPGAALEEELFGRETSAEGGRGKIGRFEQADGGTVYLDEVADLSPSAQAKLLRVLQERRFDRAGGGDAVAADVRVIASTGQNLAALAAAGQFRHDLLYRLNGFVIALPALRDRPGDIPLLAEYFLRQSARRLGKSFHAVAPEAVQLLEQHPWAGNVRELQNVVRFAAIQATGEVLTPDCLPAALRGDPGAGKPSDEVVDLAGVRRLVRDLLATGSLDIYRRVLLEVERAVIGDVLDHVGGNQVQASELLGISRNTLRSRLQAFDRAARKADRTGS